MEITLLDGSIGQELVHRAGAEATPLWSTSVMMEAPELVRALHAEYFAAGATIATANTYALHENRLNRSGIGDELPDLVAQALRLARVARDAHGSGRVAGSLGPLLASYRPELDPDLSEAERQFGALVRRMEQDVDLYIIETVSSLREAEGALLGTAEARHPVWLALTVMDTDGTRLRSGEALEDIAPLVRRFDPAAVLINCSPPEVIGAGLDHIASLDRPFGAYANGFVAITEEFLHDAPTVDVLEARTDLGPSRYAAQVMEWIGQGATIVGGCCEVGPGHIAETARRLRAAGHVIV